jgi:tRNA(Met) cytidine acetyltransferase
MSLANIVEEYAAAVRLTGYRGLVVLAAPPKQSLAALSALTSGVRGLVVATSDDVLNAAKHLAEEGWHVITEKDVVKVLGSEYNVVFVDAYGRLNANTIAAVTEAVKGGGLLVIAGPPPWDSGRFGGWSSIFNRYFKQRVLECRQHLIVEHDGSRTHIVSKRVVTDRAHRRRLPPKIEGLPGWLAKLVATLDQASAIKAVVSALEREEHQSVLLVGNRGRGKSAALGLSLAWLVARRGIGTVPIIAPSIYSVQQLFQHLVRGLRTVGVRFKAWGERPLYEGVKGAWFKIYFENSYEKPVAGIVFVDEAAAIGIARIRRLAMRVRKLVAASTVHGYEGSGKTLIQRLARELPRVSTVELREPIRYPEGDPLEEWLYRTFMLDAEPATIEIREPKLVTRRVTVDELASNYQLLRSIYSILVVAHYRNTPADLQLLLEREDVSVYALLIGDQVVSVAEVFEKDTLIRDILERNYPLSRDVRVARIVRIATHPKLQRRGFGSRLLSFVESELRGKVDVIGASFSNSEVVGFWLSNNYAILYISPRFNRVTGEKNYLAVKPLERELEVQFSAYFSEFRRRLVLSASSIYRDLPGEVIALILHKCPQWYRELEVKSPPVTEYGLHRLRRIIEADDYPELAIDVMLEILAEAARSCRLISMLEDVELKSLVLLVAQGKPSWEVKQLLGLNSVDDVVRRAIKRLAKSLHLA